MGRRLAKERRLVTLVLRAFVPGGPTLCRLFFVILCYTVSVLAAVVGYWGIIFFMVSFLAVPVASCSTNWQQVLRAGLSLRGDSLSPAQSFLVWCVGPCFWRLTLWVAWLLVVRVTAVRFIVVSMDYLVLVGGWIQDLTRRLWC